MKTLLTVALMGLGITLRGANATGELPPELAGASVVKIVQAGRECLAAGARDKARTLAEAAVARDSGYADGWKLLGALRLQAGETNQAAQAFRNALLIAPRDPTSNRELGWLLWNDDRDKALANFETVIQANPPDRDAVIRRVLGLLAEIDQAAKALDLFKRWKPSFTVAELGMSLYSSGRHLAAYPFLDAAWQSGQDRQLVGLYLASAESRKGHPDRAVACLNAYFEKVPAPLPAGQADAFWAAVLSLEGIGARREVWAQIESRYPPDSGKSGALASQFEEAAAKARSRGDTVTACEFYRQAITLDPNRVCWADQVLLEERLNGSREATLQLGRLLPRATSPAIRDGLMARIAHHEGRLGDAVAGYRASLDKVPEQLTLRLFLVRDLLANNQTEEARREIRVAEAMNRKTLTGQDRLDMADFWYEIGEVPHALALAPDLLVEKSRLLGAANDWDGALKLAVVSLSNDCNNAEAWKQAGIAYARMLNYQESKNAFERSLSLKTNDVGARVELGWTLWAMGQRDGARDIWDAALTLGVKDRERFVRQTVARMAEDNQKEWALDLHARWLPGTPFFTTGVTLFKDGRMKAAEPFLTRAWNDGMQREGVSLYLGRVRSINGVYAGTPQYFMPYITSCLSTAAPQDVTMVLDGLKVCSGVTGSGEALEAVARVMTNRQDQAAAITDLYITYARDDFDRRAFQSSMAFYEKALERDPNRVIWPTPWNLSRRINDVPRGMAMLSNLLAHTTSPAVRFGVEAKLAEARGDEATARAGYLESLKAEPSQADIHSDLFNIFIKLGELDQARREAEWMDLQIKAGDSRLREVLAMMQTQLGEDEKALEMWRFLHLSMPDDAPYYGTEMAMAQYRTGRAREALDNLQDLVIHTPIPLAFELMVQMESALAQPTQAVQSARQGLAKFSTPALRRGLAENLEAIQTPVTATSTLVAAQACVADDPGSASLSLLVTRALDASGQARDAAELHRQYLQRNGDFSPSLAFMRDYEIVMERPRYALPYGERLMASRPGDDEAVRRYAMNLAEADGFSRALRILEPLAGQDEKVVMATLVYDNTTPFDYAGLNTASQMVSHVNRLTREGFVFMNSLPGSRRPNGGVVMIILDPDSAVVEAVDAALQTNKACAIMMVRPDTLQHAVPRKPTPGRLAELKQSGRWRIGVILPDTGSASVRADGVQGNPLTHRLLIDGFQESEQVMSNRVSQVLASAAAVLGKEGPRYFFYPSGDYGQISLDTDRVAMNVLSNIVGQVFDGAFCRDDYGFYSARLDTLRVPARVVPPAWSPDDLIHHLRQVNSVVKSRLELAKLYYWHGQSEAAAHWFRKAREAGADPFEVTFNQAANAAMEGDLPVAINQSREAIKLAPPEEHRPAALLEKALDMRRPTVTLDANKWRDNENRNYWEVSGNAEGPIRDGLRWNAAVSRHDWQTKGVGKEMGSEAELGFLSYVAPEVWFKGGLQEWFMDSLPDLTGWDARLHLPNQFFHGNVEVTSQSEMMDSAEALRKEITAHREGIETYSRFYDFWDCFANGSYTERSDGNNTWWLDGRLIRRLKETPYIGVGYAGRLADSTRTTPEYWSPNQLQQHQAYAAWQATGVKWNGQLSGQTGFAKERNTGWRSIWGGRALALYKFTSRLNAGADITYQAGAVYSRTTLDAFVNIRW